MSATRGARTTVRRASPGGKGQSLRPVALVTGAGRRVGRAIAVELARAGCDVLVHYHASLAEARETARLVGKAGGRAGLIGIDLADSAGLEAAAGELARSLPRLDVVVHNASSYVRTPLETLTATQAQEAYAVNALAPLLLTRALASRLAKSPRPGGGAVVAMADIHAMGRPRAGFVAYSMAKAALVEMVASLARELAPKVRVNAVAPGVVAWPEAGPDSAAAMQKAYLARVPLGRAGTPQDAAAAVRWLALEARYTTGQVVRVDGGRWLT